MTDLGESISKVMEKTRCEFCDYTACKKSDYIRHLSTRKHIKRVNNTKNAQNENIHYELEECIGIPNNNINVSSQYTNEKNTKKISKVMEKTRCEICDYNASREYNLRLHLQSNRHIKKMKDIKSKNNKYYCECCDYITNLKPNYTKHLSSKKHIDNMNNANNAVNNNEYDSDNDSDNYSDDAHDSDSDNENANITYKHEPLTLDEIKNTDTSLDQLDNNVLMNLIMRLVSQYEKLENIVVQQSELINKQTEMTSKQTEMTSKQTEILDVISKKDFGRTTNNTNSHNTTNNTANINIFLNEKCGGAMNMTEFIQSLQYSIETLKDMGRNGFATTVTSIFKKRLNEMSIYERPIHCTDLKREVLYIKDNDEWQKDTKEKNMRDVMIKKYIPMIEKDNLKEFCKWGREHPEIHEIGNPDYEPYFSIAREVNNGRNKDINDVKIIKNICKETHLSKNMIREL